MTPIIELVDKNIKSYFMFKNLEKLHVLTRHVKIHKRPKSSF